jgi:hypothetical protein
MTQTTSPLRALLNVEALASVPKLSNAQMLDAPENSAIRDIWLPDLHAGRKVAVVATDGVEEIETCRHPAAPIGSDRSRASPYRRYRGQHRCACRRDRGAERNPGIQRCP